MSETVEAPIAALLGDQPAALYGQGCTSPHGGADARHGRVPLAERRRGASEPPPGVLATAAWENGPPGGRMRSRPSVRTPETRWRCCPPSASPPTAPRGPDRPRPHPVVVPAPGPRHAQVARSRPHHGGRREQRHDCGADLAAAALAGVAHQIADALDAVDAGAPPGLCVGGGLSAHDGLLQAVADLSGLTLEVASNPETTARGIAALAAEAVGLLAEDVAAPAIARASSHGWTPAPARERARRGDALEVHTRAEA